MDMLLTLSIGLITGAMAARKGYSFLLWTLGGGLIGLIALAFLPYANLPEQNQQEQEQLKKRANGIAGTIFGVSLALGIAIALMAQGG